MTFIWPSMLLLLLLIPLLVVMYIQMQQRRRSLAVAFGITGPVQVAVDRKLGARYHIPSLLFLAALIVLIVALARPQTVVDLPRVEGTIILAFDVSGSMAADDLKPTRMEAAKTAAREFVERQPSSVQIGVVSFSNAGFTTQPPTDDQAAILAAINRLTVQSGTSLAQGIVASLNLIAAGIDPPLTLSNRDQTETATPTAVPNGEYKSAVIVLLTDGENNMSPDPLEVAQTAEDRGVRIHTVGIGSTDGATLNLDGFTIRSRLDEETLQQISQLTGGTYYNATNEEELSTIYDSINPQLVIKPQKTEVTSLFAGAGIIILMIGGTLSLLWLSRLP
jgi:Ca-activated chloride channel family protein